MSELELEAIKKSEILDEIKKDLIASQDDEEKYKKVEELQEIVEQIDESLLDSHDTDSVPSPSTPKRRKISRAGSESNDVQLSDKQLKELEKQMKLVRKALNILYDMESTSFRKFISKNGKKRRNIVSRVPFIKRINENGQALPLWVSLEDETPPMLCGAIEADENYVAEVGDMVAALVKQDKKENWILAEVIAYDPVRKEYKVDDVYEDRKAEQTLSYNKVIPLPKMRANPETNPEALFQKNAQVLALYPGTTCFYRAVVGKPPVKPQDPYQLYFEDENYESGYSTVICVHQRYVLHYYNCSDDEEMPKNEK